MVFANKCIQNYFQNFFFLIELGLCCCAQAFSDCGKLELYSICSVWASHCGGFFCSGAWALGCMGFSSYGAPWRVESSQTRDGALVPCLGSWILTDCTTRVVP